ncbi:MAG: hypothetical protein RQ729_06600 [Wenzhouxiangellaceae bacterium]|nr:hypothetical protein [Wenzhouxiangellaceae bacterium]
MNSRILVGVIVLAGLAAGVRATEPDAWWDVCNSCMTDDDFRSRALRIPLPYTEVFVTNSELNVTQRFRRSFTAEEDPGGIYFITLSAQREAMSAQEKQVFQDTVHNASAIFISIDRDDLDGFAPSGRDSVAGDLTTGRLDPMLLHGLETYLRIEGYAGSASRVSSETSFNFGVVSYELVIKPGGDIRTSPLTIRIRYASGSTLELKISADFSDWLSVGVTDDAERPLPISDPEDGAVLDPIADQEMFFVTANQWFIDNLRRALDDMAGLTCRSEMTEDTVTVICSRSL